MLSLSKMDKMILKIPHTSKSINDWLFIKQSKRNELTIELTKNNTK